MRKPALDLSGVVRQPRTLITGASSESDLAVRSPDSLGRAEQSSPNAAWRRAEGAGLDGEDADRAIISVTALRVVVGHCPRGQSTKFYSSD